MLQNVIKQTVLTLIRRRVDTIHKGLHCLPWYYQHEIIITVTICILGHIICVDDGLFYFAW